MNNIELPTKRNMVSILGNDFFQEEIRCDYLVTEKMKQVWAVNLDLYLEFAQICEKHGLRYYAYAGTLLGAIRHKGFIPWDDDIDVCMPRLDYEKFQLIANNELSDPYFLQSPQTDPNYYRTIIRLVNKNTACFTPIFRHSGQVNGLSLDVFPLDNCNVETNEKEVEQIRLSALRCSQYMKRNDTDIMSQDDYKRWEQLMPEDPLKEWENVQKTAMLWNNNETDYYSMKVYVVSGGLYQVPLKKVWFDTAIKYNFENIEIQIPSDYKNVLKTTYGDYMKFPPIEKRGAWHTGVILDPNRPYTDYI